MAESTTVSIPDIALFKAQSLAWANQFRVVCLLDSNNYPHKNSKSKEWVLAIDAMEEIVCNDNAFDALKEFQANSRTTIFGFLSYDLKNELEKIK